jgi:2-keto-3-deoxy-L-rhamnonate aldolase RhmA
MEEFQAGRFLIPQIESPRGLENLPEMLDGYGGAISAVIIGPYDMSVMAGTPQDIYSERTQSAIRKTVEVCRGYGKSVGVFCNGAEDARRYHRIGANIFWIGTDLGFFLDGYSRAFGEAQF